MAVYVNRLAARGWIIGGLKIRSCHLTADTLEDLHSFAHYIGISRACFLDNPLPHYDLFEDERRQAVLAGAVPSLVAEPEPSWPSTSIG